MTLPIKPPFAPMEARLVDEFPTDAGWQFEPKWDGFRCLAFRDGDKVYLQSKSGQPLGRYFPELVERLRALKAKKFVLDGEIMIPIGGRTSFDDLLMRIHPAASRVKKLAAEFPSLFVIFDLLVDDRGRSHVEETLPQRRERLEQFGKKYLKSNQSIRLSPVTTRVAIARRWFAGTGASLDGVVAKRMDVPYLSGSRDGMQKIKRKKTADCVVGGLRYREGTKQVGSLLLGLFNDEGLLDHVGFTSSFPADERERLTKMLLPLRARPGFTGNAPGRPSRWSTKRSAEWEPVRNKLVVEVEYDHFTGGRFRHGTRLIRFRPDKSPRQCTFEQLEGKHGSGLSLLKHAKT